MLIRIRWFVIGAVTALGSAAYVVNQLRRMREKLAPKAVARVGVDGVADLIEATARRIDPGSR
jgi:hypothetical protein